MAKATKIKTARLTPEQAVAEVQRLLEIGQQKKPMAPDLKEFEDFRSRLAYVFLIGAFPTHTRKSTNEMLRACIVRTGSTELRPEIIQGFRLSTHPMLLTVQRFRDRGYEVMDARGSRQSDGKGRRPYGRIWVYRDLGDNRSINATVDENGAIREGHQ